MTIFAYTPVNILMSPISLNNYKINCRWPISKQTLKLKTTFQARYRNIKARPDKSLKTSLVYLITQVTALFRYFH